MRRSNPRAVECLDAVALARDPARLQQAPDRELVTAAAVLAKGLVVAIEAGGLRAQKAAALDLIDNAGRAIGAGATQAADSEATRPTDGRGRPRKREESTRVLESWAAI